MRSRTRLEPATTSESRCSLPSTFSTEPNIPDIARLSYSAHIARLPPRVALYVQASVIVSFLAASSAPTSLYAVYQARWGLTPITITIVFGIYVLAVLAALLTVGSLSDYVGRRPVLLSAIVIQVAGIPRWYLGFPLDCLVRN